MPFVSQSQQRFAFGTGQPWAKRWADETDFSKLPKRVQRVRKKAGIGGCSCGMTTKETLAPGITRIRGNLCNVHGKYGPCDAAASGKKPKGGGKGRKPKKPVKTPEQRTQEREQQHAQNRANVLSRMNIAPDGQQALEQLRNGEQPTDPAAVARAGLVEAGLAEQGRDGSYRLTGSGRAALSAADQGDVGRAGATVGAARDRIAARQDRIAARDARKKKPKGGGGKGKKPTTPAAAAAGQPAKELSPAEQRAAITFQQRQQDRQTRLARQQQADADRATRRQEADRRRAVADERRSAADERRARADLRSAARAESGTNRTNRSSQRRTKAYTPDRVLGAGHTGVMVALRPDPAAAAAIVAQPGVTEPIEQLHLTLCYLGDSTEAPLATQKEKLIREVTLWAYVNGTPLSGVVNGAGRFFHAEDDGTNAVYVAPDVCGLPELRQTLIRWLEDNGFAYTQNHGFTPHITVAYVPPRAPTPPIRIEVPITFDRVTLGWGDEQYDIPMGDSAMKAYKAGNPGDYLVVEDREKPSTWHLQVRRNGKPDHGLMGGAWAALHGGYRGNKYAGPQKDAALSKLRALYAAEKMPLPSEKAARFVVYKDSSGADRWLSVSSTAYKDRDQEIVSTKALQGAVALADASGYRGPLRFWHVPGVEIGDCDFQATAQDGRFLIESGTFRSPALAAAVKERADGYQVSIGFTHPANEPDSHGVFSHIAIFERSLVPKGRASNPFTTVALATKESRMLTTEKAAELEQLLGGNTELLTELLGNVATTDKAAQAGGVAYKDDLRAIIREELAGLLGLTEKAAPPPPTEETVEAEPAPVEAKDDGEALMAEDMPAEGDENFLSPGEIQSIVGAVVQAITPLLDIEKKMSGYVNEMKGLVGGMGAQKDAALAEVKEELKEVKAQVADLSGSQPRILAGGYRASQAAATVTTDETKLKDAQPAADPVATSFMGWLQDMGIGAQPQAQA